MGDQDRRELERALAGGEDLAARVGLLTARVRAGELTPDRLRLAAHLGDPAAREAAGAPPPPADLYAWLADLRDFGQEAWARTLLAVLETCRDEAAVDGSPLQVALDQLGAAVATWLDDGETAPVARVLEETSALLADAAPWPLRGLARYLGDVVLSPWLPEPEGPVIACPDPAALLAALEAAGGRARVDPSGRVVLEDVGRRKMPLVGVVSEATGLSLRAAKRLVDRAEGPRTPLRYLDDLVRSESIRTRVRTALLPWALDRGRRARG